MLTEIGRMAYHWPADTDFALWELACAPFLGPAIKQINDAVVQ